MEAKYNDFLLNIVKNIFKSKDLTNNDPDLKSFFTNGISFPEFVCLICNTKEIPKITKNPFSEKQKRKNNKESYVFLIKKYPILKNELSSWYVEKEKYFHTVVEYILNNIYFEKYSLYLIISQSNKLFKPLGTRLHKENELYNGLYIIKLFHILTDKEVPLVEKFDDSTDVDGLLKPIFSKYDILFFLNSNSFNYDNQKYVLMEIRLIFKTFQDKINLLLSNDQNEEEEFENNDDNEVEVENKNDLLIDEKDKSESEKIFMRLANIVGKDLGFKFYNFDEIIEEGFFPKYFMHILQINSIEGVTDVDHKSMKKQIKNIEAIVKYLTKNYPSFNCLLFDFQTRSKRSFSTRLLLRNVMNLYFLKSTREELLNRFIRLIGYRKSDNESFRYIFDLAHFIVKGTVNNDFYFYDDRLDTFCSENNVPCIVELSTFRTCILDSDFSDYFYYQLQIFFNLIDNEHPSLRIIEKLKSSDYTFRKITVPTFSTISKSIKAKYSILYNQNKQKESSFNEVNDDNDEEEDEEEEEYNELPIKMNKNPITFQDRYKKELFNNDENNNEDKIGINRNQLKIELQQSANDNLEYLNYQLHQRYFWTYEQFETIRRTHLSFLDDEYFNIIKIIGSSNLLSSLYENNLDILNDQIENDEKILKDIFSPYIKLIEMKNNPKEEEFEEVKRKGTCYIMKETESIREVKVTLEMKDDLKTIIEQDF